MRPLRVFPIEEIDGTPLRPGIHRFPTLVRLTPSKSTFDLNLHSEPHRCPRMNRRSLPTFSHSALKRVSHLLKSTMMSTGTSAPYLKGWSVGPSSRTRACHLMSPNAILLPLPTGTRYPTLPLRTGFGLATSLPLPHGHANGPLPDPAVNRSQPMPHGPAPVQRRRSRELDRDSPLHRIEIGAPHACDCQLIENLLKSSTTFRSAALNVSGSFTFVVNRIRPRHFIVSLPTTLPRSVES